MVIVLGSGPIDGDKVSRLLADRLDKEIRDMRIPPLPVRSSSPAGQGPDEKIPARAGDEKLSPRKGNPGTDITMEDKSKDTMENHGKLSEDHQKTEGQSSYRRRHLRLTDLRAMIYSNT